ncbi:hypothetical protein GGU11DRAFT_812265 [Lentinula aff. detonsa]|nr:hypothetical protein GGU11DRAFT_812265 [Lentinula aff. detonsa]
MSTTSNDNETIQQQRERILQAQAARQRAREEEIARQEAEFAAEMERIEAEEKAAQEAEEKRLAEEQRIKEEKRQEEEKRVAEERRIAEEQRKKQEELAEKKRNEERRIAEERRRAEEVAAQAEDARESSAAYAKLMQENRVERERATKELEKRQKRIPSVTVVIPPRSSGSKKKLFKSKSVISDESSEEEKELTPAPRGEKRKRLIKMIAKVVIIPIWTMTLNQKRMVRIPRPLPTTPRRIVRSGLTPDPSLHSRIPSPKFRTLSRSLVTLVAPAEAFAASLLRIFTSLHLCIFASSYPRIIVSVIDYLMIVPSIFVAVLHIAEAFVIAIALNVSHRLASSSLALRGLKGARALLIASPRPIPLR